MNSAIRPILSLFFLLLLFVSVPTLAGDPPPDQEVAALKATLDAEPADPEKLIRLADLQRIMGYSHDARETFKRAAAVLKELPTDERRKYAADYYTTRAWLEYDATNWQGAYDLGKKAVKFGGDYKAKMVRVLGASALPASWDEYYDARRSMQPFNEPGPENRKRNGWWMYHVRRFHMRLDIQNHSADHVGKVLPGSYWGELLCRRDYGYIFESRESWKLAAKYYGWSASRSPVGQGIWATRHDRRTHLQGRSDTPMPFWTNADGGYVTGSLMAYAEHACDMMMNAGPPEDQNKWAVHLGDSSSRGMAVYTLQPYPWLWRAMAWQVQGNLSRAKSDLAQARAEFRAVGQDPPLLAYANGREYLMKEKYFAAIPQLDRATEGLPHLAVCWSDLGLARVMSADPEGAMAAYDKALEIAPDMAVALHNRGLIHLQAGRNDAALEDLKKAAEVAPGDQQVITDLQRVKHLTSQ